MPGWLSPIVAVCRKRRLSLGFHALRFAIIPSVQITCEIGTNVVVGNSRDKILHHATAVLKGQASPGKVPEKWDGKAAERIVQILANLDIKRSCPA